jgi:hypothetical protein
MSLRPREMVRLIQLRPNDAEDGSMFFFGNREVFA